MPGEVEGVERLEPFEHPALGPQMRRCQTLGGYVRFADFDELRRKSEGDIGRIHEMDAWIEKEPERIRQERQRVREVAKAFFAQELETAEVVGSRAEVDRTRSLCKGLLAALDSLEDGDGPASGEEIVAVEGVVTFMRSEGDHGEDCLCCDGPHVFSRGIDVEPEPSIFPGLTKERFDQWISEALFDNRLEGRRVRVSLHLFPDSNTREEAGER